MKNFLILAAVVLSLGSPALAQVDRSRDQNFGIAESKNGQGPDTSAMWSLPVASFRDGTTTAVNPADGKILVRGVCATATVAGGQVAIYDTDRIDNLSIAANVGNLLALIQAKVTAAGSVDTAKPTCEWFPRGLPTLSGLAWLTSASTVRATVFYDKIAN